MEIICKTKITKEDNKKVLDKLMEYNKLYFEPHEYFNIGVFAYDENEFIGGIIGDIFGNWLELKYFVVDEKYRNKGIGKKILKAIEEEGKLRGCKYSLLDTFDFQARGFYEKYGYEIVLTLENYPIEGKKYFMKKEL